MNTKDIQLALVEAGFNPGPVDGIYGRMTIASIKAFQRENGLKSDGIVGPATIAKLFPNGATADEPFAVPSFMPWLQEARNLIGTREEPGKGSNEVIIGWAHELGIEDYIGDDIPWCGLFVAHCIGSQLPEEPLPANPLGARRWGRFGNETVACLGSILVFWRESKQSGNGHVGLYWGEDDKYFHVLGGNQSNSVTVARLDKSRLLTTRWPLTAAQISRIKRTATAKGRLLSQNEA